MIRALALATCLLATTGFGADTTGTRPSTLDVSASASLQAVFDSVALTIGIEVNAATFGASRERAEEVFGKVRAEVEKLGLPDLQFGYEFLVMRQASASFGERGAKMGHQLAITASKLAPGTLHPTVISLVDTALAQDKRLVVVEIEASLSPEEISRIRETLIAAATETARADAEKLATSMHALLGQPLSVTWEFSGDRERAREERDVPGLHVGSKWSLISFRESFELRRPFSSELTYHAVVRATFELKPRAP